MSKSNLNYAYITDVEVDGIDTGDYPDFCDAYIASASYPRFHWVLGWLYKLIPHNRKIKNDSGMTVVYPRFTKLHRFLGPLVYRELTEDELEEVNSHSDFVYEEVQRHLF